MKWWHRVKSSPGFIRWFNWEYWSTEAFYVPLLPFFCWLGIRAKHPCFFTAVNPGMYTGGIGFESKYKTLQMLPEAYCPKTLLVKPGTTPEQLRERMQAAGIGYPLIVKPDIGSRGLLVKKVDTEADLLSHLQSNAIDFLVQEMLQLPTEAGIFYYRMPGQQSGKITSITLKQFLGVVGDGQSTVRQLILEEPRARLQLDRLEETKGALLDTVPEKGQWISLSIIGNHSRGTKFISGNHLIDSTLLQQFDRLCDQIKGFNYGRFDIRCNSLDDLKQGGPMKIIELNGACSEPTHMYDPDYSSYWKALRDLMKHWDILCRIAIANHRLGTPYVSFPRMLQAANSHLAYLRQLTK